ncbi:MAG: DNA-3-methyladenine glycosylase [Acidobacteriota bacterium]|nr:DNA-3-methyladenine glycosylase [Acidobacteriota bacterium]
MPPKLTVLPRSFFDRDPRIVARELLGNLLLRRQGRTRIAGRIVEAEAYLGLTDPGSHAFRGRTTRNEVLFGPPGHAYVYFIYGNHYCTNVSCQPEGTPGCVLLRALEPVSGLQKMAACRGLTLPAAPTARQLAQLTSGPGRLSQALGITRPRDNGCDLCSPKGALTIAEDDFPTPEVVASPRVNVTHAPHDLWRFSIRGNLFVSAPRPKR